MEQIEFNLLEEPWIRVMTDDCKIRECSLTQALLDSHRYRRLAGELPTQDVAILRLMLAVLHTVFSRTDLDGNADPITDRSQALRRWKSLWEAGRLPEKPIREYLAQWKDRFWLFHPDHPFYQTPGADAGTAYTAAKLNGELSESSNKVRLFPVRAGEEKARLTYGEAARWLIYLNGFDDTSAKPKGKNLPSPGAGWLGKLGLIYAEGKTFFETLLLNFVLLKDGMDLWDAPRPVWELETPKSAERTEIVIPNSQAELLTLQSRRLLLRRDGDRVTGYTLLGGDFFSKINATAEQMTLWDRRSGKKNEPDYDQPKRLEPDRQIWRDYSAIAATSGGRRAPGVVSWVTMLKSKRILARNMLVHFRTQGAKYGDKDFFVEDILSDHLDFHIALLDDAGKLWDALIQDKIAQTEKAAWFLGILAEGLFKAAGGQPGSPAQAAQSRQAAQTYYAAVDIPFRNWLSSIDPDQGDDEDLRQVKDLAWRKEAYRIALKQGTEMVRLVGDAAFAGRWVKNKDKDKGTLFSAPDVFNRFLWNIRKHFEIDPARAEEKEEGSGE